MPLKGAELVSERHGRVDLIDRAVNLQAVVVDDGNKIVERMVAGKHGRLPHLALLALTVAQQRVDTVAVAPVLSGKRHSNCSRDALTERSGGHIDARGVVHVGMALQSAANMAERLELFDGKIAAICQHRIQARRRVTLGEHKAIAIGLVRVGRIDIHFLKVQIRHDVGSTERSTRMSRLGRVNRSHDTLPDLIGDLRQLLVGHTNSSLENNPGTG